MPRKARVEYAGARYHVISRGNRREWILGEPGDKQLFLKSLGEACESMQWRVHSYVLMDNHFHLLLETPQPNLSVGMRWLLGTYGNRYNKIHGLAGHVWQGRYKAALIDDENAYYFRRVSEYIHLNPARARLLKGESPKLKSYRWSSFPALCGVAARRPEWLISESIYAAYDLAGDDVGSRRKYQQYLELACSEVLSGELEKELLEERRELMRGWYIGGGTFKERLQDAVDAAVAGRKATSLMGEAKKEYVERECSALVKQACEHFGVSLAELRERPFNDFEKQLIVAMLRKRTSVSYTRMSEELRVGSNSSVYNAIRRVRDLKKGEERRKWKNLNEFMDSYH